MKIKCTCAHLIVDQTDYLRNKGHLISDTQWFNFWEAIDAAIEQSGDSPKEKKEACMQLRQQRVFKTLWECTHCGNLFVDGENGDLMLYKPENKRYNEALNRKS
ncbi:MAG: hypothetical protein ACRBFS_12100 [Aureispira sp.]